MENKTFGETALTAFIEIILILGVVMLARAYGIEINPEDLM